MRQDIQWGGQRSTGLVDVLDRVLDKGLVIAGDIKISLAEVELLTIRIRLIVCSIDKAEQVGLDWQQRSEKYVHDIFEALRPAAGSRPAEGRKYTIESVSADLDHREEPDR